ncbi:MAG: hypothetical protein JW941_04440 [Candidatus Coatesbacteria bacterium]|nr:hypothetical protein [Candidatus Coatesbacteria bacterium]
MKRGIAFAACLWVSISILMVVQAHSTSRFCEFDVYTTEDGLGSGMVERIVIAPDGRKWFSCEGALTSFDEVIWRQDARFAQSRSPNGLGLDADGTVWIAAWNEVYLLPQGSDDFCEFDVPDCVSFGDMYSELRFDASNRMWIATMGGGPDSYHVGDDPLPGSYPPGWRIYGIPSDANPLLVGDFAFDSSGGVWCATNAGLFRGSVMQPMWDDMSRDRQYSLIGYSAQGLGSPRVVGVSRDGRVWTKGMVNNSIDPNNPYLCVSEDDGESWSWLEVPSIPDGRIPSLDSIVTVDLPFANGLWLGVRYTDPSGLSWEGSGAFWLDLDNDEWTWVEGWAATIFYDIAVDEITGDVWFTTLDAGVGVLRGWLEQAPSIDLVMTTDQARYSLGDAMSLSIDVEADQKSSAVDIYVALELTSGQVIFYPSLDASWSPFWPSITIPAGTEAHDYELFSLTLPDLPAGTYRWYAACTYAGTTEFASNIASCEWEFE